jgi:hypothetical protein
MAPGRLIPGFWEARSATGNTDGTLVRTNPSVAQAVCSYKGIGDAKALIPIADFIFYVEEVEYKYSKDTAANTVTRLRRLYYGMGIVEGFKFDQLIPNVGGSCTPTLSGQMCARLEINWMDFGNNPRAQKVREHLTAHADENGMGDNPSPYIVLPNCERVDVGHLLLGLDALMHPGKPGEPYSSSDVPAIDPASWVADVGIAAVWMEYHQQFNKPHKDEAPQKKKLTLQNPATRTADEYWKMSAPSEDILGDSDAFGLEAVWKADQTKKLSELLRKYYVDANGKLDHRWRIFCQENLDQYGNPATGKAFKVVGNNKIEWDLTQKSKLITRINKFNTLYVITDTSWNPKTWAWTEYMLNKFLEWVKQGLEDELAKSQPGF